MMREPVLGAFVNRIALAGTAGRMRAPGELTVTPTVSVVIPCYKYGHYLEASVRAATEQPGVTIEVIIVDDCSPDDSATIARRLAAGDERVKVIEHTVNKGHIATYNDGLAAATGEFVALVSADDLLTPGALTRAAALLTALPSVGFVYGNAVHFSDEPPQPRSDVSGWITWQGEQWLAARCRSGFGVIASPEVVMRTSVLRQIGGYLPELPHSGDFEMWMRASCVADVGYLVGADQALYRQHATNMHKARFSLGSPEGSFTDLEQRWSAFQAVFAGVGAALPHAAELEATARRAIASDALNQASHAFARGHREHPVERFEAFAQRIDPQVMKSEAGRALARRRRLGMSSRSIHPLWAPRALALRLVESARRWRRSRVGV